MLLTTLGSNQTLGFLKSNIKVHNQDLKSTAYKTLMRPQLEYSTSVWSPYTKDNIKKIEAAQRRSATWATRPVNSPGYPVILTVLPWTYDLPSDFNLKRQTNGFRAVYRLILKSETKKKTYPGFSVFTQTKSRSLHFRLSSGIFDRSDFYF